MQQQEVRLDTVATDKETVDGTLASLRDIGTAEGAEEVDGHIEAAAEVTVEVFEQEDEKLEQTQRESEDHAGELQERSDATESDRQELADARERVDTRETAREIAEAEEAACRDQEFLDPGKDEEDQGRRESEAEQERHRSRIRASRRP